MIPIVMAAKTSGRQENQPANIPNDTPSLKTSRTAKIGAMGTATPGARPPRAICLVTWSNQRAKAAVARPMTRGTFRITRVPLDRARASR